MKTGLTFLMLSACLLVAADKKITDLPVTNSLAGAEKLVVDDGTTTWAITAVKLVQNIPSAAVQVVTGSPTTNVIFDADVATVFRFTMTNNMGFMLTNGSDAQTVTLQIMQDTVGFRTMKFVSNTGGTETNLVRFGTDIPEAACYLTTNALKTDYIRLAYHAASNFWDVIGLIRGY